MIAHLEPAGRETRAYPEHGKLLDAFLDRDGSYLEVLLARHSGGTLQNLRDQFAGD